METGGNGTENIIVEQTVTHHVVVDNTLPSTCSIEGDQMPALPSLAEEGDTSSTLGLPSPLRTTVGNACFRRLGKAVVTTVSAATTSGTWMSCSAGG